MAPGDAPLELVGGALGRDGAAVEHRDPVGEPVGLLQVLGGEEDGDPVGDQAADDVPQAAAAARVQSGGGLVEEEQARVADQAHRQVEAAAHAPGVGGGRFAGGVGQGEPLQQVGGAPAPGAAAQPVQVGHQAQVLLAGEQAVDRGVLAGDADLRAHRVGLADRVVAEDAHPAAVGADERGEDLDHSGLSGAVGAQQGEDGPGGDVQVDAVEHGLVAVGLAEPGGRDGRTGGGRCHVVLSSVHVARFIR